MAITHQQLGELHSGSSWPDCRRKILARLGGPILFSALANAMLLMTSLYSLLLFDRVLTTGSHDTLLWLSAIAIVAAVAFALLDYARRRYCARAGLWLEAVLARPVLQQSLELRRDGTPTEAGQNDIRALRATLAGETPITLLDAPWSLVFLAVIWLLHPVLASIALLGLAVLLALALAGGWLNAPAHAQLKADRAQADRHARALFAAVEHGSVLTALRNLLEHWQNRSREVLQVGDAVERRQEAAQALARAARMIVQIAVLGTGAALVLEGSLTAGGMIAAALLVGRALAPAERASAVWQARQACRQASRHLAALAATRDARPARGRPVALNEQGLSVRELSLRPSLTARPALTRVSFELGSGQTCALVGPSGAGKSALAAALAGVRRPNIGEVRFAGVPATDLAEHQEAPIAYVGPETTFAPASLVDNLTHFDEFDAERMALALRRTGLVSMIDSLPDGLDTMLDDRGWPLSHSQRAQLALTRALGQAPKFLVLDSPYHMTDAACRSAVLSLIEETRGERPTLVVVTSDPAVIDRVDQVLYLSDAVVAAYGSRDDVAAALRAKASRALRRGSAPSGPHEEEPVRV